MKCTFCGGLNIRRPFDSYIWFNQKNNQRYWSAMLNAISKKNLLTKATNYGGKRPATNQIYIMSLGFRNNKRPKPTTGVYKQGHEHISGAPYSSSSEDKQEQEENNYGATDSSKGDPSSCEVILPGVH